MPAAKSLMQVIKNWFDASLEYEFFISKLWLLSLWQLVGCRGFFRLCARCLLACSLTDRGRRVPAAGGWCRVCSLSDKVSVTPLRSDPSMLLLPLLPLSMHPQRSWPRKHIAFHLCEPTSVTADKELPRLPHSDLLLPDFCHFHTLISWLSFVRLLSAKLPLISRGTASLAKTGVLTHVKLGWSFQMNGQSQTSNSTSDDGANTRWTDKYHHTDICDDI